MTWMRIVRGKYTLGTEIEVFAFNALVSEANNLLTMLLGGDARFQENWQPHMVTPVTGDAFCYSENCGCFYHLRRVLLVNTCETGIGGSMLTKSGVKPIKASRSSILE